MPEEETTTNPPTAPKAVVPTPTPLTLFSLERGDLKFNCPVHGIKKHDGALDHVHEWTVNLVTKEVEMIAHSHYSPGTRIYHRHHDMEQQYDTIFTALLGDYERVNNGDTLNAHFYTTNR